MHDNRRETDQFTWKGLARNITLVGSAIAALLMGVGTIGTYYTHKERIRVMEKTLEAAVQNVAIISKRLDAAEAELDRRGPRILDNEREVQRLRDKYRNK